jgi:hypothetical protein
MNGAVQGQGVGVGVGVGAGVGAGAGAGALHPRKDGRYNTHSRAPSLNTNINTNTTPIPVPGPGPGPGPTGGGIAALCKRIQRSEAHAQARRAAIEEARAYGRGEVVGGGGGGGGAGLVGRSVFRDADAESTFGGSSGISAASFSYGSAYLPSGGGMSGWNGEVLVL